MKCQKCGQEIRNKAATFCPRCGASLKTGVPAEDAWRRKTPYVIKSQWILRADPPPDERPSFVRERELEQLMAALTRQRPVLLYGCTGVGKTELAADAIRRTLDAGAFEDGALWVSEVGDAPVVQICDHIACALGLREIQYLKPEEKIMRIREELTAASALLVLDDLTSREGAELFVELCLPTGQTLLAISGERFPGFQESLHLAPPGPEAALAFFRAAAGVAGDYEEAAAVCETLEHTPLALALVADSVAGDADRLKHLSRRLAECRLELSWDNALPEFDLPVTLAFVVTLEGLPTAERRVIDALAGSFAASTSFELLGDAAGLALGRVEECVGAHVVRRAVRVTSGRAGLRPVTRVMLNSRHGTDVAAARSGFLSAALAYASRYGEDTPKHQAKLRDESQNLLGAARFACGNKNWEPVLRLVGTLRQALKAASEWEGLAEAGGLGVEAATESGAAEVLPGFIKDAALAHSKRGNYRRAASLLQRKLDLDKQAEDQRGTAETYYNLGLLAQEKRDFKEARFYLKQSRDVYEQLKDRAGLAECLHQLGTVAQQEGDKGAEKYYQRALKIRESLSPDSPDVAQTLNNLGLMYQSLGGAEQQARAREFYMRALDIYDRIGGPDPPGRVDTLHNLARLHYAQGDYRQAQSIYEAVLRTRTDVLGENHPDVAHSMNNLAGMYYHLRRFDEAVGLLEKALRIYRATVGENHPAYASTLNNLAGLRHAFGNYVEAESIYKQARDILRCALGPNHPDFAQTQYNLGLLYQLMGRQQEAEHLLLDALRIWRTKTGKKHPNYARVANSLGQLYDSQKDYARAKPLLIEALEIMRKTLGEKHPEVAYSLYSVARLHQSLGDYMAAEPFLQEAREIFHQTFRKANPDEAEVLKELALICEALGRDDAAEEHYRAALAMCRDLSDTGRVFIACLSGLAELARATGRYKEAESFYRELLPLYSQSDEKHPYRLQALVSLGEMLSAQGHYEEALEFFDEGLRLAEQLKDVSGIAKIYFHLGGVHEARGEYDKAIKSYEQSREMSKAMGDKLNVARCLLRIGVIHLTRDDYEAAGRLLTDSLNLSRHDGAYLGTAEALKFFSEIVSKSGKQKDATHYSEGGLEITEPLQLLQKLRRALIGSLSEKDIRQIINLPGIDKKE